MKKEAMTTRSANVKSAWQLRGRCSTFACFAGTQRTDQKPASPPAAGTAISLRPLKIPKVSI